MKKHILLMLAVNLMAASVMGQDSIQNKTKNIGEIYIGYQQYGFQNQCLVLGGKALAGTHSKWSFGGGCESEFSIGLNTNKDENTPFPMKGFKVHTGKAGIFASVAYHLPKGLIFWDGWFGLNFIDFTAYDERCEIDDDSGITHWYKIERADGQNWTISTIVSARLSYLLPIKTVGVRFMVGYDLIPRVNQNLINENVEINASGWTEFNTYYGHPVVNLYEASEAVRKVCSMSQLYFGVSIGFFSEGSPKHETPDWNDWSNH